MAKHIITISRMYGSGGRLLARTLSSELGIHYYDKELLTLVSVEHGVNMSIVSEADEKHDEGFFKRYVPGQIASPSSRDYLSKGNIFNMTADVIRGIAEKDESCVIVGRCANHVLKDRDDVISIFVYADYDHLVRFAMAYDGISPEEAVRKIESVNRDRAAYHKYYTDRDWLDSRNYDLCLNTGKLSIDECVRVIREYIEVLDARGSKEEEETK
ncbi:MAG: cytidylate kinase-like family protein [Firmicutes bacterium]|nr:cytidylate kinase-like family protein [Bacillota bacterium]